MANIATTTYRIFGNEKDLESLNDILINAEKESERISEKTGEPYKFWVGTLIEYIGVDIEEEFSDIHGEIPYFRYDKEEKRLTIEAYSLWSKLDCIEEAIHKKFPGLKVYYLIEEFLWGIFETNDVDGKVFNEKYHISCKDDEESLDSDEELVDYLNDYHGKEVCKDLDSAFDFINESNRNFDENGFRLLIIARFPDKYANLA